MENLSRQDAIRRMRRRHSDQSRKSSSFPVTGPWSLRDTCEHCEFRAVGEHWLQCRTCWWCKPVLGDPPKLERLPAILRGRRLPPLSGKVDLHSVFNNAGFVLDVDRRSVLSMVRVYVVQCTWNNDPFIRRCGVEVRFREHGWQSAAVFYETALYKLLDVVVAAEPRKPKALWLAIQGAYSRGWPRPWERKA